MHIFVRHVFFFFPPVIYLRIYCFVPHLTGFGWISIAHSLLNVFQIWQSRLYNVIFRKCLYSHQTGNICDNSMGCSIVV